MKSDLSPIPPERPPASVYLLRPGTRTDVCFTMFEEDLRWLESISRTKRKLLNTRLRSFLEFLGIPLNGDILESADPAVRTY